MSKRSKGKKRGKRTKVHRNKYKYPNWEDEAKAREERSRNYWSRKWQRAL